MNIVYFSTRKEHLPFRSLSWPRCVYDEWDEVRPLHQSSVASQLPRAGVLGWWLYKVLLYPSTSHRAPPQEEDVASVLKRLGMWLGESCHK